MRVFLSVFAAVALVGIAGCKAVPRPTPINELNKAQLHGRTVFQVRCGVCHYDRKDEALHGPALVGIFKKPSLPSGAAATDERVTATIQHGRGLMPAVGNDLDQQDLDDLLAYLHTL